MGMSLFHASDFAFLVSFNWAGVRVQVGVAVEEAEEELSALPWRPFII